MASWTDGPEYAPTVRPTAFVAPVADALPNPEPAAAPAADLPLSEPTFQPPASPAPDLRELVPSAAPGRNPNLPFESLTTPLTEVAEPAQIRDPHRPFAEPGPPMNASPAAPVAQAPAQVNPPPFAAPGAPSWPAVPGQPYPPAPSVTLGQMWKTATNWVMVPALIGMFIAPVAPVAFLVAAVSTSQILYRRKAVRRAWLIIGIVVLVLTVLAVFADPFTDFYDVLGWSALVGCWIAAIASLAIVGSALRNGEPPDA